MFETLPPLIQQYLTQKRLPNTLLFSGPNGKAVALDLAAELLQANPEHHPDFHLVTPEGKSGLHSIESLRKAIDESHSAPFQASAKIFLIESAERMQPAAANALLKTLEEPNLESYWILLTTNPSDILPTILSRCAKISLHSHQITLQSPEEEEARKLLFSLLTTKPPYTILSKTLETIETLLETEDPLLKVRRAESLFQVITLYYRDATLRQIDPQSPHLHFPQESTTTTLPKWEKPLEKARLAFERNIKLSVCLESIFLKYL